MWGQVGEPAACQRRDDVAKFNCGGVKYFWIVEWNIFEYCSPVFSGYLSVGVWGEEEQRREDIEMCLLPSASRRQLGIIHKDAAINLEQYQD